MEEFQFQYSNISYKSKPVSFDKTTQFWNYYTRVTANIEQMAAAITDGRCWRNGIYDPAERSFKKQYVTGTQFVVLDFDKVGFEPQEMIDAAKNLGMPPNMWYYSFSQGIKEGNNFRMVWVLDRVINQAEFAATMERFLSVFKKYSPDGNTKDISRMWYAGAMGVKILSRELGHWDSWGIKIKLEKPHGVLDAVNEPRLEADGAFEYKPRIKIKNWERDLDLYCTLWKKMKRGGYLNRMERLILMSNLRLIENSFDVVVSILKKHEGVYIEKSSNLSINELKSWWRDNKLTPKPIIKHRGINYTVIQWFNARAF